MATLIAPSGTVVHVDDEFAARLAEQGFKVQEKSRPRAEAKRPAKSGK